MTATSSDLYARIVAFPIDEGAPDLSFAARLARENGWPARFAGRVVAEYRRFVYLAMTAGHPVTPSEEVDQAWHLHLTYTRSYWDRLCGETLGRPLHHGPTRGGAAEATKYTEQYDRTLASYRAAFGEDAPADIWPPAARRFGADLHAVRVNTARNWVIPKAPVRRTAAAVTVAAVAVFFSGCDGAVFNPFRLVGPEFLTVLILALAAAFVVGRLLRRRASGPAPRPGDEDVKLDWVQSAYLAGGAARVVTAALARLVAAGSARVSADGKFVEPAPGVVVPAGRSPAELEVWQALPLSREDRAVRDALARRVEAAVGDVAAGLAEAGYVLGPVRRFAAGVLAFLPVALVLLVFAAPRLTDNLTSRRFVGDVVAVTVAAVALGLVSALVPNTGHSRRGRSVLRALRKSHAKTAETADPAAVGAAVGLFGTAALANSSLAALAALAVWYPHPTTASSVGCGSGCSSGGGGCGGGCGGCGGGGCGCGG